MAQGDEDVQVFVTKQFRRFQRRERIKDAALCDAIERADRGLIDADLGGGVIKQRVARTGQGRSGGFRTIIAYRRKTRSVFVEGFAKSERDNLSDDELTAIKKTAVTVLALSDDDIAALLEAGKWTEVMCDGEDVQE